MSRGVSGLEIASPALRRMLGSLRVVLGDDRYDMLTRKTIKLEHEARKMHFSSFDTKKVSLSSIKTKDRNACSNNRMIACGDNTFYQKWVNTSNPSTPTKKSRGSPISQSFHQSQSRGSYETNQKTLIKDSVSKDVPRFLIRRSKNKELRLIKSPEDKIKKLKCIKTDNIELHQGTPLQGYPSIKSNQNNMNIHPNYAPKISLFDDNNHEKPLVYLPLPEQKLQILNKCSPLLNRNWVDKTSISANYFRIPASIQIKDAIEKGKQLIEQAKEDMNDGIDNPKDIKASLKKKFMRAAELITKLKYAGLTQMDVKSNLT